jgi:hypothetical protein
LGNILSKSNVFTRDFRLTNTGPKDIEIEWKMYNFESKKELDQKYFNIEIVPPELGSSNLAKL